MIPYEYVFYRVCLNKKTDVYLPKVLFDGFRDKCSMDYTNSFIVGLQ